MDELDDILSGEAPVEPSAGFSGRVMHSVLLADQAPPLPSFPWIRALTASVASGVMVWAGVLAWRDGAATWALVGRTLEPAVPVIAYAVATAFVVIASLRLQGEPTEDS